MSDYSIYVKIDNNIDIPEIDVINNEAVNQGLASKNEFDDYNPEFIDEIDRQTNLY